MFDIPTHSANADLSASFHATMAQIAVVGGGITGAAAACRLARNGCKVTVFDMGRTVGVYHGSSLCQPPIACSKHSAPQLLSRP